MCEIRKSHTLNKIVKYSKRFEYFCLKKKKILNESLWDVLSQQSGITQQW